MGKLEKVLLFGLFAGMFVCLFMALVLEHRYPENKAAWSVLPALGFVGAFFGMSAVVLVLRDLYLRDFRDANAKMLWTLAILMTAGIGLLVYIFRHAVKPRPHRSEAGPLS